MTEKAPSTLHLYPSADSWRAGWTDHAARAPNLGVYTKMHV